MTTHVDIETLSTYLDRELSAPEIRQVQQHLELCDGCRQRLWSLEKVVGNLKQLDRLAPPPHLESNVHRLASLQISRPSLAQRLEKNLERFTYSSLVLPFFAIVVALILIIYMLSWGLQRESTGRIPVNLEPNIPRMESSGSESRQRLAGRSFQKVGGMWIEEGLEQTAVVQFLSPDDPRVQSWLADSPDRLEIAALGGRVRLRLVDEVVEIQFDNP